MPNEPEHHIFALIADLEDASVEEGDALPPHEAIDVLNRLGEMTAMCAEMLHQKCETPDSR